MELRSIWVWVCGCVCVCVFMCELWMRVESLLLKMLCNCLLFLCTFLSLCLQSAGFSSAPVPCVTAPGSNEAARSTVIEPCQGCPLRPQCVCQLINPKPLSSPLSSPFFILALFQVLIPSLCMWRFRNGE